MNLWMNEVNDIMQHSELCPRRNGLLALSPPRSTDTLVITHEGCLTTRDEKQSTMLYAHTDILVWSTCLLVETLGPASLVSSVAGTMRAKQTPKWGNLETCPEPTTPQASVVLHQCAMLS